jgi:zinc/manganese transport system substrate-binding protein
MKQWFAAACAAIFLAAPAHAALNVFACEPEWGALATELGGSDVSVFVATTAKQDPHQVQARPALIARLRSADLAVCTGAELEIGWMPALLRQAANSKVQPGAIGYFPAADQVPRLEIPRRLDRSEGDVHPSGNPHVQTDARNIRVIAVALAARMAQIDPGGGAGYAQRRDDFLRRWDAAVARWQAEAAPLNGAKAVVHHKSWPYLFDWLGITEVAAIEPKPGIPPSSAYIAQLLDQIPRLQPRMIVYAAYQDARPPQVVAERSGLPAVLLPFTVGGTDAAKDLFGLFDDTIARLLTAAGRQRGPS